jgi:cyanophycinase
MVVSFVFWSFGALGADQRLLLIGGGDSPPAAIERFVGWSGGASSKILLITWASEAADEAYKDHVAEFAPHHPGSILWSKAPPQTPAAKAEFLDVLSQATAVFFGGGDQNRIFTVIQDEVILHALQARYQAGVPFAGTSAGTAIMSTIAIGGGDPDVIDGTLVPTGHGLGLLPDTILDMHFMRRGRENRLFGLVLEYPDHLGIGVDEDTSLAVENGRCAEVIGPGDVMMVDAMRIPGSLIVTLAHPGERLNLVNRSKTTQDCQ